MARPLVTIEYDSASRPPRAIEELIELRGSGALLHALVERNLKVRYKRSLLGVLWSMLGPAGMLVALSLVFTRAFAPLAPSYPAYVFPGLLLWTFFAQSTSMTAEEVAGGNDLWRRLRFPKTALVLSTILTNALNLCFALVPLLLVLALLRRPLGLALLTLPVTMALAAAFTLGLSLILATAALYFHDVIPGWAMLLPALMFTAPIAYPMSILPPWAARIVAWNPVTFYVEAFRAPLYTNAFPVALLLPMVLIAAATLAIGWVFFTASTDEIAYRA